MHWPLICIILVYPEPTICHGSSISTAICWSVIIPVRCQWWGWWCSLWWLLGWRWEYHICCDAAISCAICWPLSKMSMVWVVVVVFTLACFVALPFHTVYSESLTITNIFKSCFHNWRELPKWCFCLTLEVGNGMLPFVLVHQPLWMAIHTTLHVNWQLSFYPLETSLRFWNELSWSKSTSKSEQFSDTHQSRGLHVKW